MTHQIDVKSLISHIVKGDGVDKCRICMGETTDGQVYLGDTVMMDGDRPVTLSELLEVITGVEVPLEAVLPSGLCLQCFASVKTIMDFRNRCRHANEQWYSVLTMLETIPEQTPDAKSKLLYAFIDQNQITFVEYASENTETKKEIDVDKSELLKKNKKGSKGKFQCKFCDKTFMYASFLHAHLLEAEEKACFKCGSIMSRDELAVHLKLKHGKRYYPCEKCPALLPSLSQQAKHMQTTHSAGSYTCNCCGRGFKTLTGCHVHVAMHEARNCPSCKKLFRNLKCYRHHVKKCCGLTLDTSKTFNRGNNIKKDKGKDIVTVKSEGEEYKVGASGGVNKICYCDYCGKKFSSKKYVCAHITIVHTKSTHTPCPYCGKSYAAANMTEHIKKHEMKSPSFTCEHCGVVLKSRLGYEQHIRLHTGEKPYPCQYCFQSFSASSRRSAHILQKHKNPELSLKHKCPKCKAKFKLPYLLKKHMELHGMSRSRPVFKCPECQVVFNSCRGLMHHRRKHDSFKQTPKIVVEEEEEED